LRLGVRLCVHLYVRFYGFNLALLTPKRINQPAAMSKPSHLPLGLSRRTLIGLMTVVLALFLWWVATSLTGLISPARFPRPYEVGEALQQIISTGYGNGRLHQHVLHSIKLVAMGFAVAVGIGVPLGLLMGHSRRAEALLNPAFLLLRPIPPLAWIPLAIVWLGLDDASKILVIFVAAFVPSVINSYTGVKNIETPILEAAKMLNIRGWSLVREVLVPGALPMIFTGLRLSLQASWTTLVAAELIGALYGLGSILNQAAQDIYPAMILVGMMGVAICGAFSTALLGKLENRAMPWRNQRAIQ
jgi:taurine transport system permease protein